MVIIFNSYVKLPEGILKLPKQMVGYFCVSISEDDL